MSKKRAEELPEDLGHSDFVQYINTDAFADSAVTRGEMRTRDNGKYYFEAAGLASFYKLARLGMTPEEIADYFTCEVALILELIAPGGQAHALYRRATAELKLESRAIILKSAARSSGTAKIVSSQVLGQSDTPREDPNKPKPMLGSEPEWEKSSADWEKQLPEQKDEGSVIDALKAMSKSGDVAA